MKILGAAIGNCVHVAGVLRFLDLAEQEGHETLFLGPATSVEDLVARVKEYDPDMVGVSYRLTAESVEGLFGELREAIDEHSLRDKRWVLGCTAPLKPIAEKFNIFEEVFTGFATREDVTDYLRGRTSLQVEARYPQDLLTRITVRSPLPILRHHYGVPSLEETIKGVKQIAKAQVLDVVSIGPDQNAQQFFFSPEKMVKRLSGDGGVPVREPAHFKALFDASRCGNYPLLRCYSGTNDLIEWAEMLKETINNAWCATPLTWYSELDGRSNRPLLDAISENQENYRWHASHSIPVEVNESHQWSLRDAHDTIAVAMAYLAAYNAKAAGVRHYVAQYMMNTPLGTSPKMDLAKMLAKIYLIESLHDHTFTSVRQTRAGLFAFPPDMDMGKGQLASSVYTSMMLKPHIMHVVGYCEADHAATAPEVIESCKIARRVIHDCMQSVPDPLYDPSVKQRRDELIREATLLVEAIKRIGVEGCGDPLVDPETYVEAVRTGLLDAPHLRNNPVAKGQLKTKIVDGACRAISPETGEVITEQERLEDLGLFETTEILQMTRWVQTAWLVTS